MLNQEVLLQVAEQVKSSPTDENITAFLSTVGKAIHVSKTTKKFLNNVSDVYSEILNPNLNREEVIQQCEIATEFATNVATDVYTVLQPIMKSSNSDLGVRLSQLLIQTPMAEYIAEVFVNCMEQEKRQ